MSLHQEFQPSESEERETNWQVEQLAGLCGSIRPFLEKLVHLPAKGQIKEHVATAIKELETIRQRVELLTQAPSEEMGTEANKPGEALTKESTFRTAGLEEIKNEPLHTASTAATKWNTMEYFLKEMPVVIYAARHTPPYDVTYISENILSITGYTPAEFIGESDFWATHLHPDDVPTVFKHLPKILEESVLTLEYRFRFKDGSYHWMYDLVRLTYDELGQVNGLVGSWLDITAKKQAEEQVVRLLQETQSLNEELQQSLKKMQEVNQKLADSEAFSRQIIDNVPGGIAIWDREGHYVVWNAFLEKLSGKTEKELLGRHPIEAFPELFEKDMTPFYQFQQALAGEIVPFPDYYAEMGGTKNWYTGVFVPFKNSQGEIIGVLSTSLLITDRKRAEEENTRLLKETQALNEELRASEEEVRQTLEKTLEINEQLAASEQFNKQIINSMNEALAVYDKELRFVVWNPFAEKVFGLPAEKVIGKNPLELFPEVFNKEPERYHQMQQALAGETVTYQDLYVPFSETTGEWFTGVHSPFKNSHGEIIGVISMGSVITERKQAEQAVLHQKNLLQAFYDAARFSMCVFELTEDDFIYQLPNRAMAEFCGLSVEEMTGKTAGELQQLPPEAINYWFGLFKTCVETGKAIPLEYPFPHPDGRVEWHYGSFSPISANTIAFISTEITDRKRAEEENIRLLKETQALNEDLQASQYKLKEAQKIARLGNWEWEVATQQMEWSEEVFRIFGVVPAAGVPDFESYLQLIDPEFREKFRKAVNDAVDLGKGYEIEIKILPVDMPFRWSLGMGRPVFNATGEVIKLIGIWYDITDRKMAEEQIRELLRLSQEMNDRLMAGEEELRQSLEKTMELNERILESEQRWQFALEGSEAGVWDWDMRTDQVFYNQRFKELMGYQEAEVVNKLSHWLSKIHPEDKEAVLMAIDKHRNGETESYQAEYRALGKGNQCSWLLGRGKIVEKDKKGRPVRMIGTITNITERKQYEEVLANSANYLNKIINTLIDPMFVKDRQHRWVLANEALCHFHQLTREQLIGKTDYDFFPKEEADIFWQRDDFVFTTGEDDIHEETLTHPDGKSHTLLTKKSLYVDSSGEPFIVGIFVDITDRKQIEQKLQQQNEDLRRINAELDSFVYRASHDLRAPLVSILGLINISRLESEANKKASYLDMMEKSIVRLDTFISDIINYSRNSRLEVVRTEIDFQHLVQETMEGLEFLEGFDTIEKRIQINQNVPFFSDGFRLKIICNNLVSNAIKYRSVSTAQSYILIRIHVNDRRAVLTFKDNGIGISQESIDKIFDMFYRASASGTGSGLGLYIVKNVVHTLEGNITVQSEPGKGTTFAITIPNLTINSSPDHP